LCTEGRKEAEDLENIFMAIVKIDLAQDSNVTVITVLYVEVIYFRLFLELDIVFQSCQRWGLSSFK
jgi:hypothetical protein